MEPAGRASEPAGRASEPAGRAKEPAGRAPKLGGRPHGWGGRTDGRKTKTEKISLCGDAIGHCPLRGRCPKGVRKQNLISHISYYVKYGKWAENASCEVSNKTLPNTEQTILHTRPFTIKSISVRPP